MMACKRSVIASKSYPVVQMWLNGISVNTAGIMLANKTEE
jgi:hypothetical protein